MEHADVVLQNVDVNMKDLRVGSRFVVDWDIWNIGVNDQDHVGFSDAFVFSKPERKVNEIGMVMREVDSGRAALVDRNGPFLGQFYKFVNCAKVSTEVRGNDKRFLSGR